MREEITNIFGSIEKVFVGGNPESLKTNKRIPGGLYGSSLIGTPNALNTLHMWRRDKLFVGYIGDHSLYIG